MPLNAGKSGAFVGLFLISSLGTVAQTTAPTSAPQTTAPPVVTNQTTAVPNSSVLPPTNALPSAADVMRARVAKAKAFIAIKNYAAAIYELEGINRESKDPAVNSVTQVMLMNCYLEQMDYKRAQNFLTELFTAQKTAKPGTNYFAAAGQVVKSARNQLDRYKSLGLTVSDRNLPTEAVADVDKMRETLEMVVTQSKTLGVEKKSAPDAMALLEEASVARVSLARDEYDAKRWKDTIADVRDDLMNSRTAVINAVEEPTADINSNNAVASTVPVSTSAMTPPPPSQIPPTSSVNQNRQTANPPAPNTVAENNSSNPFIKKTVTSTPTQSPPTSVAREKRAEEPKKAVENNSAPNNEETKVAENKPQPVQPAPVKDSSPLQVGSLIEYATEKANPMYPPAARMMRKTGTVRVEVLVDEQGKIEDIKNSSGESLLQRAALDAIKKWKFKPFVRDGQPVKATGYVNFNFNL